MMRPEIDAAVLLAAKLLFPAASYTPALVNQRFRSALRVSLEKKFDRHWYTSHPLKGSGYRALVTSPCSPDPLLYRACCAAMRGAPEASIRAVFTVSFVIWCDPGEVSVQLGETGTPWTHWSPLSSGVPASEPSSSESDDFSCESDDSGGRGGLLQLVSPTIIRRRRSAHLSPSAPAFTPIVISPCKGSSPTQNKNVTADVPGLCTVDPIATGAPPGDKPYPRPRSRHRRGKKRGQHSP
jgi:hypothetical protein